MGLKRAAFELVGRVHYLVTNNVQCRTKLAPIKGRVAVTLPRDYI
jgi:hypothetical protein